MEYLHKGKKQNWKITFKNRTGPRHRVTMLFGNFLFIIIFFLNKSRKPREKSYTSELVLNLKRFEVGAYAVPGRLTAGITGFLGGGVHPVRVRPSSSANVPRYTVYQIQ
jgi:hypothetical protein